MKKKKKSPADQVKNEVLGVCNVCKEDITRANAQPPITHTCKDCYAKIDFNARYKL